MISPNSQVHSQNTSGLDGMHITVRLLENDNTWRLVVPSHVTGKWLLEEICRRYDILDEMEYFGLRYVSCEMLSSPTKHWMDLTRSVQSQLKNTNPLQVSFRIKHYPANPFNEFKLEKSKYLLFHQLRRDFLSGRLIAPHDTLIKMAALFVEVILGDASELEPPTPAQSAESPTYLSNVRYLHTQSKRTEQEVIAEHRKLHGLLPSEAAAEVIRIATGLESYGIEPFRVHAKHQKSRTVHIGLTHEGIAEFSGSKRTHMYKWNTIEEILYKGRHLIIIHSKPTGRLTADYKCESKAIASSLWAWALERKMFFTLENSAVAQPIKTKHGFFSRRHTFNFSGRCQTEIMNRQSSASTLPMPSRSHHHLRTDAESVNSHTFDVPRAASSEPGFSHLRDSAITPASGTLDTCEEILESLEVSENGISNTEVVTVSEPKPPHLSLAPFFERTLANRKAAPNAGTRANEEIVMRATDSIQNAPPNSERDINENISKTHKQNNKPPCVQQSLVPENSSCQQDSRTQTTGNSMQVVGNIEEVGPQSSEVETNSRLGLFWRGALLPGGILTLTLLGAILAVELDVHAPLLDGLRSSSPFAAWEQHCYRPLRSLIFGLFHH
uniref:FERM domain-containing protein n=1 Tax=Schistocephalus solidus TaxID=70667 RepID=A0A0X3NGF3_SCHSO